MPFTRRRREGFALAVAIAAIVVIGALIAGVFFASSQQYRIGRNTMLQARAVTAAEYGVNALFDPTQPDSAKWKPAWNNAANGIRDTLVYASNGAVDTVQVTKLNDDNFFVASRAHVGNASGSQSERSVGTLVALNVAKINVRGALTSRGNVKVGGSSLTNGNDTPIPGWGCPPPDSSLPGISVPDTSKITYSGCKDCILGNPPVQEDSAAGSDSTYFSFGGLDWETLVNMAQKRLTSSSASPTPSSTADGSCDTSDPENWGDPEDLLGTGACSSYFPIIYAPGDVGLTNGVGQGILLVEGNLKVTGQFSFYGAVIVKGTMSTAGHGNHFNGALMAANVDLDQNTVLGDAVVQYSSCALSRAVKGSALPVRASLRPWVELY
jgi:hypothetical protein